MRRAKREEEFFLYRFGGQLEQRARAQLAAEDGRRKSIALPAGRVGFRNQPARLEVVDERLLLAWCKLELPAAVVVEERISKKVVTGYIKQTGECPDGAAISGDTERFFVG